jgi:hypothetical protein
MRNDGEGAAAGGFEVELGHGGGEVVAKGRDYTVAALKVGAPQGLPLVAGDTAPP